MVTAGRRVRVHVRLKGSLAGYVPGGQDEVDVAEGAEVGTLVQLLGLPGRHVVFVVNGTTVKPDAVLREGDRVQAFPPMAGGARFVGR
jgi:sulfur carrier protein ThiS